MQRDREDWRADLEIIRFDSFLEPRAKVVNAKWVKERKEKDRRAYDFKVRVLDGALPASNHRAIYRLLNAKPAGHTKFKQDTT